MTPPPSPADGPVVIVGGGPTAATAARTLHQHGLGAVTVLSAEPHAPYDRTHLSKGLLSGARDAAEPLFPDDLAAVDLRLDAEVVDLDLDAAEVTLADGGRVPYGTLLLAPGARPRTLPLPGIDLDGVHLVRELAALERLSAELTPGQQLVVIGGGLIGLEVAAAARARGVDVTVLEVADQLLGRVVPAELAAAIAEEHDRNDVTLRLPCRPTRLQDDGYGRVGGVELADGDRVAADVVVVAVGVEPRIELAAAAGLTVDDGIVVDEHLRTDVPGVLAAGDAARVYDADGRLRPRTEAWTPAMAMGQHAAATIVGEDRPYREVPWMWSDQHELRLQAAGAPVDGTTQVRRGELQDRAGLAVLGLDGDRVVGVAGVSRGGGIGRVVRGAVALIERGTRVDPDQLADPDVDLRRLAREAR